MSVVRQLGHQGVAAGAGQQPLTLRHQRLGDSGGVGADEAGEREAGVAGVERAELRVGPLPLRIWRGEGQGERNGHVTHVTLAPPPTSTLCMSCIHMCVYKRET